MKILFFGDIFGRIGRTAFSQNIEKLKRQYQPDCIIVNVDNISSGRGAIPKHIDIMSSLGVDIMTGGDHIFDNFVKTKPLLYLDDSNILAPCNIDGADWPQYAVKKIGDETIVVIHLLSQAFMSAIRSNNPFLKAESILEEINKKYDNPTIFIDMHGETTAEKYGLAYFLQGKVDAVIGTHTHIQTSDLHDIGEGTLVMADAGMCGPLYSVIGADFASVRNRFLTGIQKGKIEQSLDKEYLLQGMFFEKEDGILKEYGTIKIQGVLR